MLLAHWVADSAEMVIEDTDDRSVVAAEIIPNHHGLEDALVDLGYRKVGPWQRHEQGATAPVEGIMIDTDERLDLEFAYVNYANSCKELYSPLVCCRRLAGHEGVHAAGFGEHRIRW